MLNPTQFPSAPMLFLPRPRFVLAPLSNSLPVSQIIAESSLIPSLRPSTTSSHLATVTWHSTMFAWARTAASKVAENTKNVASFIDAFLSMPQELINESVPVVLTPIHPAAADYWEEMLDEWVEEAPKPELQARTIARSRINNFIADKATLLDLSELGLTSLPHILQYAQLLETFYCNGNKLFHLNVRWFTALKTLDCSDNKINFLNLNLYNQNNVLENLYCKNNKIHQLDLEDCPAIKTLHCSNNNLEKLVLKDDLSLEFLYCSDNPDLILSEALKEAIANNV